MCRLRVGGDAESGVESADGICQRGQPLTGRQRNLPSETWLLCVSSTGIPGNSSRLRLLSDPATQPNNFVLTEQKGQGAEEKIITKHLSQSYDFFRPEPIFLVLLSRDLLKECVVFLKRVIKG